MSDFVSITNWDLSCSSSVSLQYDSVNLTSFESTSLQLWLSHSTSVSTLLMILDEIYSAWNRVLGLDISIIISCVGIGMSIDVFVVITTKKTYKNTETKKCDSTPTFLLLLLIIIILSILLEKPIYFYLWNKFVAHYILLELW